MTLGGGARHGPVDADHVMIPRALFAPGISVMEGERGLFIPVIEGPAILLKSSGSSETATLSDRHLHGSVGLSLTIIVTPGLPAHLVRVGFLDTHDPQTKVS